MAKNNKKQLVVWMSYDLGVRGDYPGLYKWLDIRKAKECGNSIAFFHYEYDSDLDKELKKDLEENIEFKNGDRIYIVSEILLNNKKRIRGKFIIGNRKASPWEGYSPIGEDIIDG